MIAPGIRSAQKSLDSGVNERLLRRSHGEDNEKKREVDDSTHDDTDENFQVVDASITSPASTSLAASPPLFPSPISMASGSTGGNGSRMNTLHFMTLKNATTCQSYTFSWIYDGTPPASKIVLSVLNDAYPPDMKNYLATIDSTLSIQPSPLRTLSTNISSSSTTFTWELVDLVQGWYMLDAQVPDRSVNFTPQTSPLFIMNGTNTSCIMYSEPVSLGRPPLSTGDIIGIIIGAIAAAGLLAIAFTFPRWWRRDLPSLKKRRPYYLY